MEEFSEQLELFARENNEVGTVSIRHVQRIAAGQFASDRLRPATARLLERHFESPIEELLISPENKNLSARRSDLLAQADQPDCAASALGLRAGKVASLCRRDSLKQHSVVFSALGFDELRHLGAALDDARRYCDIEVVGYFKKQLNSCASNDGAHGPAQALPPALGVVAAIEIHAREVKADVRRELLTVGAQAAEFVGWLYRDARQPRLSGHWRDRAMEWAQEAGDLPMQGYLLLKKSQAAWDERDGLRMLTLAQAAHDGPWQLPPLVRAEVTQQEARGLAMTGESSAVVDAKLDEAWEIFTAAEATASELGCHYDRALLAMQTAICYCEAGRPGQAALVYREHLNDGHISRRDRGYFLSLTASAWTQAAEPDNAASAGQEALTIAVETYSLRTIHELKRVCVLLEPWRSQPAVRDLRDAVLPL
ncbi:MAG: XRE family transcriptional regulator [Pseudonocardiaceae bacterium]